VPDFSQQPAGIAGAGNVAQALGRLLAARGLPVVAVAARDPGRARRAAAFIGGDVRAVSIPELPLCAQNILVAVSDSAISGVAATLRGAGLLLHTCGGLGPEVLRPSGLPDARCGVLHPLQTVMAPQQGVQDLPGVPFGIAGGDEALAWAEWVARLAGGLPVRVAPHAMPLYHAAAVMAGNCLIGLVDAAAAILRQAGVPPEDATRALGPLARASLENALRSGSVNAITGPIARGDSTTVSRHLEALESSAPFAAPLYRAAGMRVLDIVRRRGSLPEAAAREIDLLLHAGGRP
jgi:predicted short-subunit dehydrogenase-like oxidoreductase (DUF2520 family)